MFRSSRARGAGLSRLAVAVVLLVSGPAAAQAPPQTLTPVEQGRELVLKNCGMCHAVGAVDASPNAQAPAFRDLHRRYPIENLEEALGEGILTGHPQMPQFVFAPAEVAAVIAYLKSVQTAQGVRLSPPPRSGVGR